MPSQAVYEFRSPAIRTDATSLKSFFLPGNVISISDSPAFSRTSEQEMVESDRDGLGCARGVRAAFLLEAGMFVLAYGVWHLWQLVR